jgi:hypothetical protein
MAKGGSRGKGKIPHAPRGKPVPAPRRVGKAPAGEAAGGKGGSRGKGKIPKPGSGK